MPKKKKAKNPYWPSLLKTFTASKSVTKGLTWQYSEEKCTFRYLNFSQTDMSFLRNQKVAKIATFCKKWPNFVTPRLLWSSERSGTESYRAFGAVKSQKRLKT